MGSGLISLFGRRMSYAPSLFPTLDLVCGAAFWGLHGVEKWLSTFDLWSCVTSTAWYSVLRVSSTRV